MNNTTPQEEILQLEAANAAMVVKTNAIGIAGSLVGIYLARKHNVNTWGKIGYFFAGSALAQLPMTLLFASKKANNLARIQQLKTEYNL